MPPYAVVVAFHSWNAHGNQFAFMASILAQQGIETVTFDMKGFGKSEGQRGKIANYEFLIQDCNDFVDKIYELYENVPIFVLGASLGGLFAAYTSYYRQDKIKG